MVMRIPEGGGAGTRGGGMGAARARKAEVMKPTKQAVPKRVITERAKYTVKKTITGKKVLTNEASGKKLVIPKKQPIDILSIELGRGRAAAKAAGLNPKKSKSNYNQPPIRS